MSGSSRRGTPVIVTKRRSSSCCWSLLPLVCMGSALGVGAWIYKACHTEIPFCCKNVHFKHCNPCPDHAICRSGNMVCEPGFIRNSNMCVRNEEYDHRRWDKARQIADYIASNVMSNCKESRVRFSDISMRFSSSHKDDPTPADVMDLVKTYRNIWKDGDWYVTNETIPTMKLRSLKCQLRASCNEHRGLVVIIVIWTGGVLGFIFGTIRKKRIRRAINAEVDDIICALRSDRSNDFKYASCFERVETHPLWKYWNEIVKRVERNPSVVTLNSSNGRMWRCE